MSDETRAWWKSAVVYQIYPRSFADSDGDGVGDLRGIIEHLDHLNGAPGSLGVDALFLETCYLDEPESYGDDLTADAAPVRVGFSWGHPWPDGRFHGLDGGRSWGAELELGRWIEAAARLRHPVLRITGGSPA